MKKTRGVILCVFTLSSKDILWRGTRVREESTKITKWREREFSPTTTVLLSGPPRVSKLSRSRRRRLVLLLTCLKVVVSFLFNFLLFSFKSIMIKNVNLPKFLQSYSLSLLPNYHIKCFYFFSKVLYIF